MNDRNKGTKTNEKKKDEINFTHTLSFPSVTQSTAKSTLVIVLGVFAIKPEAHTPEVVG
jgi:hypothetical protein